MSSLITESDLSHPGQPLLWRTDLEMVDPSPVFISWAFPNMRKNILHLHPKHHPRSHDGFMCATWIASPSLSRSPGSFPRHDLFGTAIGLPISWGGARGVCLGRQSYGSPMECMALRWASPGRVTRSELRPAWDVAYLAERNAPWPVRLLGEPPSFPMKYLRWCLTVFGVGLEGPNTF